ncbi:hypothetical protein, partial [Mycobacteroides abscessus]|uniref:hypothetical protein n=1 Tax=Mycobacteroides abscessus TaxID=36809 RepID=UPI000ADC69EA
PLSRQRRANHLYTLICEEPQNVVAEELIWGAAQLRLQGFGQGAPHNGWVQFCHRATVYEYRFKSEYTPLVER